MNRAGLEELHRKISGEGNRMDISTQLGIVKKKEVNKHNLRLHISMIFKRWWCHGQKQEKFKCNSGGK